MPYNQNIPQPTDQISDSQNDLLNNFQSIKTLIDVNHVTFDDPNQGKHFFVEMPQQAMASPTAAGEVGIQCLASAFTTTQGANAPTLVMLNQSAAAPIEMSSGLMNSQGWSFLPSGLLIKWGTFTIGALGTGTIGLNGAGRPSYANSIYYVGFQTAANSIVDPNIYINLNSTFTTLSTLTYLAVARDSSIPSFFSRPIYYYVIGT